MRPKLLCIRMILNRLPNDENRYIPSFTLITIRIVFR